MKLYHSLLVCCIASTVISSCGGVRTSTQWPNPQAVDVPTWPYGAFIRAEGILANSKYFLIEGEFLGMIGDSSIAVQTTEGRYLIPTSSIQYTGFIVHSNYPGSFLGATLGTVILSASNGWWLILSAPVSLVVGLFATDAEATNGTYVAEVIDDRVNQHVWKKAVKYARYPQGVPASLIPNLRTISND